VYGDMCAKMFPAACHNVKKLYPKFMIGGRLCSLSPTASDEKAARLAASGLRA
jgi:hypothetical protein